MILPIYRGWVLIVSVVVCVATWYVTERTRLGSYLRAATENPGLVQAFGINVPRMITVTYGLGVALAGFAGVLDALAVIDFGQLAAQRAPEAQREWGARVVSLWRQDHGLDHQPAFSARRDARSAPTAGRAPSS